MKSVVAKPMPVVPVSKPGTGLFKRRYDEHMTGAPNALRYWYKARNHLDGRLLGPLRIALNYLVVMMCKNISSLSLKNHIYRALGMKIGRNVTIAAGVMMDPYFPELIEIGDNSIVGMDVLLITHEFLHDRFRSGRVVLGKDCLIGARCTVLAGVSLGDRTTVSAMSLVCKGTPADSFVGGVPLQHIELSRECNSAMEAEAA